MPDLITVHLDDKPIYDTSTPFTTWTTKKAEKSHEVIGLIAGHSYIFVEDKQHDYH